MSDKQKTLSLQDKEGIKRTILESAAKLILNPIKLAEETCKAIEYINSYPQDRSSDHHNQ